MAKFVNMRALKTPKKNNSKDYFIVIPTILIAITIGFFGYLIYEISKLDFEIPGIGG